MAGDRKWFRQDSDELKDEWLYFLSAEARCAWMYLKGEVKTNAKSQKAPNRATRLKPAVAAHQWRVSIEAIAEIEQAAIEAGELTIEDDCWVVTDKDGFCSPKTTERHQKEHLSDNSRQTTPNEDNPVRATVTVTETFGRSNDLPSGGAPPDAAATTDPPPPEPESEPETPYALVERTLTLVAEQLGTGKVPDRSVVIQHVAPHKPLMLLITELGVEETVALRIWAAKKVPNGLSWSSLLNQKDVLLAQMRAGGVETVPRLPAGAAKPEEPKTFDKGIVILSGTGLEYGYQVKGIPVELKGAELDAYIEQRVADEKPGVRRKYPVR